nr:unnamed protein product [Digitaria exilis]
MYIAPSHPSSRLMCRCRVAKLTVEEAAHYKKPLAFPSTENQYRYWLLRGETNMRPKVLLAILAVAAVLATLPFGEAERGLSSPRSESLAAAGHDEEEVGGKGADERPWPCCEHCGMCLFYVPSRCTARTVARPPPLAFVECPSSGARTSSLKTSAGAAARLDLLAHDTQGVI